MTKRTARGYTQALVLGAAGFSVGGLAACGGGAPLDTPGLSAPPAHKPVEPPASSASTLPPISGGTLLVATRSHTVVAADPERDSVWMVDTDTVQLRGRITLPAGSEPGRLVEDSDGKVHVVLRGGGAVAKLDLASSTVVSTRPVCPAPRGIAYDAGSDNLHVACAGGELVTMKGRGGDPMRALRLDNDLRDVVMKGDHLLVSRFRSAEVLELDGNGGIVARVKPRVATGDLRDPQGMAGTSSPTTAWRLLPGPGTGAYLLHQRGFDGQVLITGSMGPGGPKTPPGPGPGGYGSGPCKGSSIVTAGLTQLSGDTVTPVGIAGGTMLSGLAMAVDAALSPDGSELAVISPAKPLTATAPAVSVVRVGSLAMTDNCQLPSTFLPSSPPAWQPVAVAYARAGQVWVQSRAYPPAIYLFDYRAVALSAVTLTGAEERSDPGHALFHAPTQAMIACASCHAEAGDDGHVWNFNPIGGRRTQNLRGGLLATAPFHWDGDMRDLSVLMQDVFVGRMSGTAVSAQDVTAVGSWLDGQQALRRSAPVDAAAVERGKALFNNKVVGCATCHSGAHFTNNQTVDVGTGHAVQVPSLIGIAFRAPYMHTGCAATLSDRFREDCGGGDRHGHTSQLSATDLNDLVSYLETL